MMENKAAWHHKVPTAEEYEQIIRDFAERRAGLGKAHAADGTSEGGLEGKEANHE